MSLLLRPPSPLNMLTPTSWIRPILAGCLFYTSVASCSYIGMEESPFMTSDVDPIYYWIYSFLIFFCGLVGYFFLAALVIVLAERRAFDCYYFLAVTWWLVQLITYAAYVKDIYTRNYFSYPVYVVHHMFDQLTDLFLVGGMLYLVHYKWKFHKSMGASFFRYKWALDASLMIIHAGAIGYTTTFLVFSAASPEDDNKHLQWLTSYYVYTAVYALVVANIAAAIGLLKTKQRVDQVKSF